MYPADQADPLLLALDELAVLAGEADVEAVGALRARLADQRLRVLVAGEAKRGKSTLANAELDAAPQLASSSHPPMRW